jgi:hypothetical protein
LAKHSIPMVPACLTHQIWPPATSSSSPGWRAPWRGKDFKMLRRYNQIRNGSCRPFPNKSTRHALKSERIAAYNLEGPTLKEITSSNL